MSRTRDRVKNANPAKKFIKLSGVTGKFGYWDKEQGCTIELEYPIKAFPLDVLSTIKGYNDPAQSGIYSNEVHSISVEPLNVKIFDGGEIANGLYADIKDKVKSSGGRFCNSVYCMMYDENDEPQIVNFQMMGSSLFPFIEWTKSAKMIYKVAMVISGVNPAKKGATHYYVPVYESAEMTERDNMFADSLDQKLQEYLDQYKSDVKHEPEKEVNDVVNNVDDGGVPF